MPLQSCHSGLDPESSLFNLDSRSPIKAFEDKVRGNDGIRNIIRLLLRHDTNEFIGFGGLGCVFRLGMAFGAFSFFALMAFAIIIIVILVIIVAVFTDVDVI